MSALPSRLLIMPLMLLIKMSAAAALAPKASSSIWPQPMEFTAHGGPSTVMVAGAPYFFQLRGDRRSPILSAAFARYAALAFPHVADASKSTCPSGAAEVYRLEFHVSDLSEDHPAITTDESYTLTINSTAQAVHAKTVYGALHALETFAQLVSFNFDCGRYELPYSAIVVADAPRFPHRGLMIDTARHYQPLASLRAMIDSLPFAKLNVLHWHLVDTQSFPFASSTYPKLSQAAYAPSQRYTHGDVRTRISTARAIACSPKEHPSDPPPSDPPPSDPPPSGPPP